MPQYPRVLAPAEQQRSSEHGKVRYVQMLEDAEGFGAHMPEADAALPCRFGIVRADLQRRTYHWLSPPIPSYHPK